MKKTVIQDLLEQAKRGEPVFLPKAREAFYSEANSKIICIAEPAAGNQRRYVLPLPKAETAEEKAFATAYVYASLYNLLCVLGGAKITLKLPPEDAFAQEICKTLDTVFQVGLPHEARSGYGKCLNVADRVNAALGKAPFRFDIVEGSNAACQNTQITGDLAADESGNASAALLALQTAVTRAQTGMFCGMDIGGTDIKLAAVLNGRLTVLKEFDWNPAGMATVAELTEPILLLARVMQWALHLPETAEGAALRRRLLDQHATVSDMQQAVSEAEALYSVPEPWDGIGVSFPDVVIGDKIVGGETTKTAGIRAHAVDYEREFLQLTDLREQLRCMCRPGGAVHITNDGNMAAYTAAAELAHSPNSGLTAGGVFAHTLGTELGSGWINSRGEIPPIPLEIYNCIIDLGSWPARAYPAEDVRSIRNWNTGLYGTLQRYCSQSGAYRLAERYFAVDAPNALSALMNEEYLKKDAQGGLVVPTAPKDMRKPFLERLMDMAQAGQPEAEQVFREIGRYLAAVWQETEWMLTPEAKPRILFGRFIKKERCFQLLQEGAAQVCPVALEAGNEGLAYTKIMRQLASEKSYTVAQFGQAVGAVYFVAGVV